MNIIRKNIETIQRFIHFCRETTLVIPVALILLAILGNWALEKSFKQALAFDGENKSYLAQNTAIFSSEDNFIYNNLITAEDNGSISSEEIYNIDNDAVGAIIIDDSALLNTGNPQSGNIINRDGLIAYKVQNGDTLSRIAANFGISLDTIYWANKSIKSSALKIGQEINILPISGIIHQVQDGETLESIASFYEIPESRIIKHNQKALSRGQITGLNLIIPGAKPKNNETSTAAKLPSFPGYYALPTTGWNWGIMHNNNAVDIANACGTPIYAAAEGLVSEVKSGGWNDGYGGYLIIEHPNNTKTRYAHNQKNVVSVGDYVVQGDIIGYIGNTGLTHGPTGCHVHFEVIGARNPFVK